MPCTANLRRLLLASAILGLGCGDDGLDVDPSPNGGHGSFDEVEIVEVTTSTTLAVWSLETGWQDADGGALVALPPSAATEEGGLEGLRAGGPPASLRVDMRGGGNRVTLAAVEPPEPPDGSTAPTCGEFSVRYFPLDDDTRVIAWPNEPPPDAPGSPAQYARRQAGAVVPIYHCDRIDLYPEQPGTVNLELVLWHVNHADQASDPLPIDILDT